MTGNRPPPLPPGDPYRRPSAMGIPVAPEHAAAFAMAITPDTHVGASAKAIWSGAIALVTVTAAAAWFAAGLYSRLTASESNAEKALTQIIALTEEVKKLKPEAIKAEGVRRLNEAISKGAFRVDCPPVTWKGAGNVPCPARGFIASEE